MFLKRLGEWIMYLISTMHLHELLRPRHEQPLGGLQPTQRRYKSNKGYYGPPD